MTKPMSERERVHKRLFDHLVEHKDVWTAPYGIEASVRRLSRGGAVREILFGTARYLDATILVWSPDRIVIDAEGPLAYEVAGTYSTPDEAIAALSKLYRQETGNEPEVPLPVPPVTTPED